jgi:hypothetical protein
MLKAPRVSSAPRIAGPDQAGVEAEVVERSHDPRDHPEAAEDRAHALLDERSVVLHHPEPAERRDAQREGGQAVRHVSPRLEREREEPAREDSRRHEPRKAHVPDDGQDERDDEARERQDQRDVYHAADGGAHARDQNLARPRGKSHARTAAPASISRRST